MAKRRRTFKMRKKKIACDAAQHVANKFSRLRVTRAFCVAHTNEGISREENFTIMRALGTFVMLFWVVRVFSIFRVVPRERKSLKILSVFHLNCYQKKVWLVLKIFMLCGKVLHKKFSGKSIVEKHERISIKALLKAFLIPFLLFESTVAKIPRESSPRYRHATCSKCLKRRSTIRIFTSASRRNRKLSKMNWYNFIYELYDSAFLFRIQKH